MDGVNKVVIELCTVVPLFHPQHDMPGSNDDCMYVHCTMSLNMYAELVMTSYNFPTTII